MAEIPHHIIRDMIVDDLPDAEKIWHLLKRDPGRPLTLHKVARDDGPEGERHYIAYILTDKTNKEDINWDKKC